MGKGMGSSERSVRVRAYLRVAVDKQGARALADSGVASDNRISARCSPVLDAGNGQGMKGKAQSTIDSDRHSIHISIHADFSCQACRGSLVPGESPRSSRGFPGPFLRPHDVSVQNRIILIHHCLGPSLKFTMWRPDLISPSSRRNEKG